MLSKVDRSDLGNQQRLPGVFYAEDARFPRSRDEHLRVVCAVWPVPCPSSCWSRTVGYYNINRYDYFQFKEI